MFSPVPEPRDAASSLQSLSAPLGSSGETGFHQTLAQGCDSPCKCCEGHVRQETRCRGPQRGGLSPEVCDTGCPAPGQAVPVNTP